jgi:hypothetical protein
MINTGILGAFPALRAGNRAFRSNKFLPGFAGQKLIPLQSLARSQGNPFPR